jgi:hypothetical protein
MGPHRNRLSFFILHSSFILPHFLPFCLLPSAFLRASFYLTVSCIWRKLLSVRNAASYALLITFLLMGTGALEYLHNWAHELEDRLEDQKEAVAEALAAPPLPPNMHRIPMQRQHEHDENNCEVHAQLHMAIILYSWTPLLIWLGIWIAFLSLLAVPLIPRPLPERIDCRGPPCALFSYSL